MAKPVLLGVIPLPRQLKPFANKVQAVLRVQSCKGNKFDYIIQLVPGWRFEEYGAYNLEGHVVRLSHYFNLSWLPNIFKDKVKECNCDGCIVAQK